MKKEYICYYFDKSFKGRVDETIFDTAKTYLMCLLVENDLDISNTVLRAFTKIYYEMHDKIEHKLQRMERNYKIIDFSQLNFLQKMGCKKELAQIRKTYSNFGKFSHAFFSAFGISLVKVKDVIDAETKQQDANHNN